MAEENKLIDLEGVKIGLKEIQEEVEDYNPDYAHEAEDRLRHEVLRAIAAGAPNAQELAAEALKSSEMQFERWYS